MTPQARRVFLVDEHPLMREGIKRRLANSNSFEVVGEAAELFESLAAIEATNADVVVVDLDAIHAHPSSYVPSLKRICAAAIAVVLSRHAHPVNVSEALRAGAKAYVLKRSHPEVIAQALQTVSFGGTFLDKGVDATSMFRRGDLERLSRRELQVLQLVGQAMSSKDVARTLNICARTVESHRRGIARKIGLSGHAAMVKYAAEHALELGRGTELQNARLAPHVDDGVTSSNSPQIPARRG